MNGTFSEIELEKAYQARQKGNEGMSRVLARRAAGLAIRDYLQTQKIDIGNFSLNSLLKNEDIRKHLPFVIYEALDHLTTRVGMDYHLPIEYDLLSDAQIILSQLSISNGDKK